MKNRDGLTNSDHWQTPDWLYNELNDVFNFDFDPCPINADFDGLSIEWGRSNFVNPPYNRIDKPKFIHKAIEEYHKGKTCVLLIPAAMGTIDTHKLLELCPVRCTLDEWREDPFKVSSFIFPKGRIAFKGYNTKGQWTEKNKGKHDSMIVILSP